MYLQKKIFTTLLFVFTSFITFCQNDIILKTNGEELVGKVIKINEKDIVFTYQNETLEYNISKNEIAKITFSSGRIQYFKAHTETVTKNFEDHHNKVAILPFGYIKDQERTNVMMSKKIQQETYSVFRSKANNLKFQDPNTTNALLKKAGITDNIDGYTMGEICNILGVEYIVQGIVSIEKTSVTNYNNTTTKKNNNVKVDKNGRIIGNVFGNSNTSSNSYGSTTQNYSTNITMNVYTDKGNNVFSKDHMSFWQTQDAYKITIKYLAKRTPIYKR
ncbi:hypothetical protein [Polaribacter aestuariivivens]|uniref:hypothetical protein n=1 Tax=Polaribacter aestuariivivens TaxID=2304626 RepID=UPI003F494FF6